MLTHASASLRASSAPSAASPHRPRASATADRSAAAPLSAAHASASASHVRCSTSRHSIRSPPPAPPSSASAAASSARATAAAPLGWPSGNAPRIESTVSAHSASSCAAQVVGAGKGLSAVRPQCVSCARDAPRRKTTPTGTRLAPLSGAARRHRRGVEALREAELRPEHLGALVPEPLLPREHNLPPEALLRALRPPLGELQRPERAGHLRARRGGVSEWRNERYRKRCSVRRGG